MNYAGFQDEIRTIGRLGLIVALIVGNNCLEDVCGAAPAAGAQQDLTWPPINRQCKPWTYNWWLGSAVDRQNLARELDRYHEGGLGGIHIVPIYGAQGTERRWVPYLSPQWMANLDMAVIEAAARDLGVDMTTGTGWCFGGPGVTVDQAGIGVTAMNIDFPTDGHLPKRFAHRKTNWRFLEAVSPQGRRTDLSDRIDGAGKLRWRPDAATKGWKLVGVGLWPTGIQVKRAAPGGEGFMINPFYGKSMGNYLESFTRAFDDYRGAKPRAMYHDSYEYAMAAWSPDLPEEFAQRRGYKLEDHWEQLAGFGDADLVARTWYDYRETISELMLEKVFPQWTAWCRQRGFITRYQAHGSPGNLLDLYALADIPETEMFGHGGPDPLVSRFDEDLGKADRDTLASKFASSAAHVAGRPLVASETGTWLAEHFHETFEEMKCLVDRLFVSGVNHVFYHGCVYSPDDVPWPGWLFYASTQMNPRNPLWREATTLNRYIARTQSVLQSGQSDNDVLLYWPVCDLWMSKTSGVEMMAVHNRFWVPKLAYTLSERGFAFDYVSDRQLVGLTTTGVALVAPGGRYRVLMIPASRTIPLETLEAALKLAQQGATVCFATPVAQDVPGLARLDQRRAAFRRLLAVLGAGDDQKVRSITAGAGRILVGPALETLPAADIRREGIADHAGALFVRRSHVEGRYYFIANQSVQSMDGWFTLATSADSVVAMDPLSGRTGVAATRSAGDGGCAVRLDLLPGHSLILRTFTRRTVAGPAWDVPHAGATLATLAGPWQVEFIAGGPAMPKPWTAATLSSWTTNGDPATESFSGTARYSLRFDRPTANGRMVLDLGEVRHVARVRLNGQELGTLIMHPYCLELPVDRLQAVGNRLELEVTNLGANRLRDLDRRKVQWRKFYFVNIRYTGFDAAQWPVEDSGLLGPVTLRKLQERPGGH
ncbi:MAG: glycosyl hydrolase [Thermoguttaceae bacterium]